MSELKPFLTEAAESLRQYVLCTKTLRFQARHDALADLDILDVGLTGIFNHITKVEMERDKVLDSMSDEVVQSIIVREQLMEGMLRFATLEAAVKRVEKILNEAEMFGDDPDFTEDIRTALVIDPPAALVAPKPEKQKCLALSLGEDCRYDGEGTCVCGYIPNYDRSDDGPDSGARADALGRQEVLPAGEPSGDSTVARADRQVGGVPAIGGSGQDPGVREGFSGDVRGRRVGSEADAPDAPPLGGNPLCWSPRRQKYFSIDKVLDSLETSEAERNSWRREAHALSALRLQAIRERDEALEELKEERKPPDGWEPAKAQWHQWHLDREKAQRVRAEVAEARNEQLEQVLRRSASWVRDAARQYEFEGEQESGGYAVTTQLIRDIDSYLVVRKGDTVDELYHLCCQCGTITAESSWTYWHRPLEHEETPGAFDEWVTARDGEGDPGCKCPACGWMHQDTDDGSGFYDGSLAQMEKQREKDEPEYHEWWAENLKDSGPT